MICVLCNETITAPEHPGLDGAVHEINPQTMRRAWMHGICLQLAVEDLTTEQRERWIEATQED